MLITIETEPAKADASVFPPLFCVKAGTSADVGENTTTVRTCLSNVSKGSTK